LYAGGELGRRKEETIRAHLDRCPGCRAEAADYRAALERAKAMAAEAAPLDWTEAEWRRMMTTITATPIRREAGHSFSLRPALAAAATFLLVVWGTQYAVRYIVRTSHITSTATPGEAPAAEPLAGGAAFDRASPAAVAKVAGLEDPKFPVLTSAKQDVPALTMISPESGLKIVWFFNENLKLED
jgi:anti-sigma factor RsiW